MANSLQDVVTSINNMAQVLSKLIQSTSLGVVVPVTGGGTGATTEAAARMNLGLGAVSTEDVVPVNEGGTGNTAPGPVAANAIGALAIASNLSDLGSSATARTNLGLGTAATHAASNNALANVASVSGVTTAGHLAVFADTTGSVADGGAVGSAAAQGYSATSFTPVLRLGGASTGITYSAQAGFSVQIGSIVVGVYSLVLTSKGSATGAVTIGGLPVASGANAANAGAGGSVSSFSNLASLTGAVVSQIGASSSALALLQEGAAATAALTDANVTNTSAISGQFIYGTT